MKDLRAIDLLHDEPHFKMAFDAKTFQHVTHPARVNRKEGRELQENSTALPLHGLPRRDVFYSVSQASRPEKVTQTTRLAHQAPPQSHLGQLHQQSRAKSAHQVLPQSQGGAMN